MQAILDDVLHDARGVGVERQAVLGLLEELEVVGMARVRRERAPRGGSAEWPGAGPARRAGDVGLDHRRDVVVLAGIAGDDPAAGAVADDHDLGAADLGRGRRGRAVAARRDAVAAALHVADDVVEHRAMRGGGERVAAAGLVEVVALGVAEPVVGVDDVAGAGERAGDRPGRREVPVLGRGGDPVDEHDRGLTGAHRAVGEPLAVEDAAPVRPGWSPAGTPTRRRSGCRTPSAALRRAR